MTTTCLKGNSGIFPWVAHISSFVCVINKIDVSVTFIQLRQTTCSFFVVLKTWGEGWKLWRLTAVATSEARLQASKWNKGNEANPFLSVLLIHQYSDVGFRQSHSSLENTSEWFMLSYKVLTSPSLFSLSGRCGRIWIYNFIYRAVFILR